MFVVPVTRTASTRVPGKGLVTHTVVAGAITKHVCDRYQRDNETNVVLAYSGNLTD